MKKEFGRDINRFNKVPVIHENDGFKLSETVAIYHYLGRKRLIPYPADDFKQIARIDEYLSWQHNSLASSTGILFFDAWVKPFRNINVIPHGQMVNVGRSLEYVVLDQSLDDLEKIWLNDSKFLVGDEPTFADLIAACLIMQVVGIKLYSLDANKFPKVAQWLLSVKNFYNPEFDNAHQMIYKFGERFNGRPPYFLIYANNVWRKIRKIFK